jgi:hypothetical protein
VRGIRAVFKPGSFSFPEHCLPWLKFRLMTSTGSSPVQLAPSFICYGQCTHRQCCKCLRCLLGRQHELIRESIFWVCGRLDYFLGSGSESALNNMENIALVKPFSNLSLHNSHHRISVFLTGHISIPNLLGLDRIIILESLLRQRLIHVRLFPFRFILPFHLDHPSQCSTHPSALLIMGKFKNGIQTSLKYMPKHFTTHFMKK